MADYFASGAAGRCGMGGVLPHRPAAEAAGAGRGDPRLDAGRHRPDEWLLDECYAVVGDGAETAALRARSGCRRSRRRPATMRRRAWPQWIEQRILPLRQLDPDDATRARAPSGSRGLDRWQRFILLKLLTGELRLGVSQTLVVRALAAGRGAASRRPSPPG